MSGPQHTNRLATETSPYLLQHAHNPVDWYPWGSEALARARETGRPIFLSIGYAACHWCHVMERESFEDEATAAVLNERFVPVKVDREERPDLDAVYMDAVQAMTGQGGWPMSVFLTPEKEPFYGGTYFPNERRHGLPSFMDVLHAVDRAWRESPDDVRAAGRRVVEAITPEQHDHAAGSGVPAGRGIDAALLDAAAAAFERSFDAAHGGWGSAPKFPQPMAVEALLAHHARTGDDRSLAVARRTLDAMAAGGIRDHLGGGFARYSTDAHWLVPHFEKMLYDNAQLTRVYVLAFQATGDPAYRDVARSTLDFMARELRVEGGGFASSLDADTEGEEGATYTWQAGEIDRILGEDATLFRAAYGVTDHGSWEGTNVLSRVRSAESLADAHRLTVDDVAARLAAARARLLEVRDRRPQPGRDDKVIAAWNGLALAAFAEAARLLESEPDRERAVETADFLLRELRGPDGELRRTWKDGRVGPPAVLEDLTHLAHGLLALYEATFDERWFLEARRLMDQVLERFEDPAGGFFDTAADAEALVVRPKGLQDNAVPSGNAVAATVLLRLAALSGEARYGDAAERAIALVAPVLPRYPTAFAQWLVAVDLLVGPVDELAIVGDPSDPATAAFLRTAWDRPRPRLVTAVAGDPAASAVPLLEGRVRRDDRVTAYLCRGFACREPVTDATALGAQLGPVPGA